MKAHTTLGSRLFSNAQSEFDDAASQVALNHHERWDGQGYPGFVGAPDGKPLFDSTRASGSTGGKCCQDIPLFGRIVAIADVFDALSSQRVYKDAWDESNVLATIEQGAGSQFDPELVEVFFSCLNVLRSIQKRYQDIV